MWSSVACPRALPSWLDKVGTEPAIFQSDVDCSASAHTTCSSFHSLAPSESMKYLKVV